MNEINIIKSQSIKTPQFQIAIKCKVGSYYKRSERTCSICEAGYYCPGDNSKYNCQKGTYSLEGASTCDNCPAGYLHFLEEMNVIHVLKEHIHQIWDLHV